MHPHILASAVLRTTQCLTEFSQALLWLRAGLSSVVRFRRLGLLRGSQVLHISLGELQGFAVSLSMKSFGPRFVASIPSSLLVSVCGTVQVGLFPSEARLTALKASLALYELQPSSHQSLQTSFHLIGRQLLRDSSAQISEFFTVQALLLLVF